jgi:IclR family pca regulon transcriptional regulator
MNDELRNSFASLAPPIVASPAKRIEALTGDPDFMTSLARGLAVIHAFQERKRHLTIAQISHRTEIPRAAVRRCLLTLIKLGYATTDGRTYSLLPKVLTLGHAYLSSTPLAVSSQPYLDRMSDQLHEACNMATLEGEDILYIARSATTQRLISVDLSVGGRLPAYCTSMGRILLSALDDVSLHEYLDNVDLQPKTSRTIRTARMPAAGSAAGLVHRRSGTGAGPAFHRRAGLRRLRPGIGCVKCQHQRRSRGAQRAGAAILADHA